MITATLRATGGSIALTLPRKLAQNVGLDVGSKVEISVSEGRLVLSPIRKPQYRLDDLLAECEGDSFTADQEWLDSPAAGDEAW